MSINFLDKLTIEGFRGCGERITIEFAKPDKEKDGSGLTVLVGPNNSGKSTILESLRAFNGTIEPSFSEQKRNIKTGRGVFLQLEFQEEHKIVTIISYDASSETIKTPKDSAKIFYIPPRRNILSNFGKADFDLNTCINTSMNFKQDRSKNFDSFHYIIENIFKNEQKKSVVNDIMKRILGFDFIWKIELNESGNYYVKFTNNNVEHSSEGVGDGIWSLLTIAIALTSADECSCIVIDEPELSIHPSYQKNLKRVLSEKAKQYQIIIATHSPYFIEFDDFINGGFLYRVINDGVTKIFKLGKASIDVIKRLKDDNYNVHLFGLEAKEIFFLSDNVILTEGQEDIIGYKKIIKDLGLNELNAQFYGWGSGGANNIINIATILNDLHFQKVYCIYDGDKKEQCENFKKLITNPNYKAVTLFKNDIRDKDKQKTKDSKEGLLNKNFTLKEDNPELKKETEEFMNDIYDYFK